MVAAKAGRSNAGAIQHNGKGSETTHIVILDVMQNSQHSADHELRLTPNILPSAFLTNRLQSASSTFSGVN
jgi:hypothetical protein